MHLFNLNRNQFCSISTAVFFHSRIRPPTVLAAISMCTMYLDTNLLKGTFTYNWEAARTRVAVKKRENILHQISNKTSKYLTCLHECSNMLEKNHKYLLGNSRHG